MTAKRRGGGRDFEESIRRELLIGDGTATAFRQGVGDNTRPIAAQAMGIQGLIGQGRSSEAAAAAAAWLTLSRSGSDLLR